MPNYEVEMKFRHPDLMAFEALLLSKQPQKIGAPVLEADTYFDNGQLQEKDEWLRVRMFGGQIQSSVLTYKGPRIDTETKTRIEIESPIENGLELFQHLGFQTILQVKKYRRRASYTTHSADKKNIFHINVLLDDVWELGSFVELELPSIMIENVEEAKAVLQKAAEELQLTDPENNGYAILLLEKIHIDNENLLVV